MFNEAKFSQHNSTNLINNSIVIIQTLFVNCRWKCPGRRTLSKPYQMKALFRV